MFDSIEKFHQSYELGSELGRGAFAICYKATNKLTGQLVAVKKISLNNHNVKPPPLSNPRKPSSTKYKSCKNSIIQNLSNSSPHTPPKKISISSPTTKTEKIYNK